jgi:hypothetical protein
MFALPNAAHLYSDIKKLIDQKEWLNALDIVAVSVFLTV